MALALRFGGGVKAPAFGSLAIRGTRHNPGSVLIVTVAPGDHPRSAADAMRCAPPAATACAADQKLADAATTSVLVR